MSKKNVVVNKEIKNEKEIVKMSKNGNKTIDEAKAVNELAALLKTPVVNKKYSLDANDLLHLFNTGKYLDKSDIVGDCHVYIQNYETDISVHHADSTFVYSINKDNPERDDVQPDDVLQAYVRLYVKLVQGKKTAYTTITVYEGMFDRLATSILNAINNTYPEGVPMTLIDLLDKAVGLEKPIPVYRKVNAADTVITYWCMYTHQPRHKIQFKLNKAENYEILKSALNSNLYYPILQHGKTAVVTIQDLFVRFCGEDKSIVRRFGLKLVADNFEYIIDLEIPAEVKDNNGVVLNQARRNGVAVAIRNIIVALSSVLDNEKFTDIEKACNAFKGHKVSFKPCLQSSDGINKYEVFYFGKEVK